MRSPIPMIPHFPIRDSRCFHRGSFTYFVIPGISYRFISKYDIMCFSCIHPYHSRNLHTDIRLFHTGFIGWTEPVDEFHAYTTPPISTTTTMKNSMTTKDSMGMHTGNGCCLLFLQCPMFPQWNRRISENEYKRIRPEKVEGFPDRIRLANYADVGVFPHQRFHGKSGSSGLSEHIINICRRCTMHGIWKTT